MSIDSLRLIGRQVGARLRDARLAKNYTQSQLARPDFSVSYISAIERGQIQPSLRALEILAEKLEISSTDLLPEPEPPIPEPSPAELRAQEENQLEISLLEARIAIHQGHPEQAVELLRNLAMQREDLCRESIYRFLLGWAYLESGSVQESEQLLARTIHNISDPLYPRILDVQVSAYTAMHNTEQGTQLQRASIAYLEIPADSLTNPFFRARLYNSLAQHYSHQGQFEQVGEMLRQALRALEVLETHQRHLSTCWQLSEMYRESGQERLAALYHHRAVLLDTQMRLLSLRSEIQHALGHIVLRRGSDGAYASLESLSQEAITWCDPLAQASANVHLASWYLARENDTEAEHYIQEAQRLAGLAGETLIAADVQFLLGDLAYRRQDYVTADQYIETGLAMLERLREGEELIERLAQYARRLEERGLINKAIVYWKRAYENREKGWPASL